MLLCKDIELACDEKVTKDKDKNWKATYCQVLLDCSYQRKMITARPVAFGEVSVKMRIKSVLNYKKAAFWIGVTAIVISVIVAVCFMTNPAEKPDATDAKNEMEENEEAVEKNTTVGAIVEEWAKAFVGGDGQTIISMSTQDAINDFENRGILEKRGNDVYFGFGSSPMLDWGEDVISYRILSQDEINQTADILYFAWTSDPHVTVLREQITYIKSNSKCLINTEKLIFYDNVTSAEELFKAYPFQLEGSLMDYYKGNNFGEALNSNALESSHYLYQELFEPETAALNLLNIDRGVSTEEVTYGDADVRGVILHFTDEMVEIEMIRPFGSNGIWVPRGFKVAESKSGTENQKPIFAEGNFDNIMGYSGHYIYYEGYSLEGYYYASDGTLLASVWGTTPEEVGVIDLDGDGKNELIAGLMWEADGGTNVVVYKEFENGIRYAYCSDMFVENYDNFGIGALVVEYLKETNQVKFSYWNDEEQSFRTAIYDIYPDWLTWWTPNWLAADELYSNIPEETKGNDFFGDQRDWLCGTISEIMPGTINGTEFTISLKYYVSEDDSDMIRKLGLTEEDFPGGYAVEPVGETRIYPVSENCEFIFIDWSHTFINDSRVESYDENHVITDDYSVFKEYLDTYKSLNHQFFFYDIQDGKIQTIYEVMHPSTVGTFLLS